MARVSVEQKALSDSTDPRYKILAELIGVDRWSALGRMCVLWNICQETGSYVLSEAVVNGSQSLSELKLNGAQTFSEAVLKSGLGKKHRHGIYISGSRGRVEWLENKRRTARKNGSKGGRPPRKPIENQDRLQQETSPALAPALKKKPSRPRLRDDVFPDDSREMKAARYLFGKVRENNPDAKEPNIQGWARSFGKIFRLDGRDPADVRQVIDWCQADAFWLKNILSPDALRKQYDRLKLAMKPAAKAAQSSPPRFTA